jgi:hypothetical protein
VSIKEERGQAQRQGWQTKGGIQGCRAPVPHPFQVDKDWHYRKEERRWIATNDKSGWQRVTFKNKRWTSETFYIR